VTWCAVISGRRQASGSWNPGSSQVFSSRSDNSRRCNRQNHRDNNTPHWSCNISGIDWPNPGSPGGSARSGWAADGIVAAGSSDGRAEVVAGLAQTAGPVAEEAFLAPVPRWSQQGCSRPLACRAVQWRPLLVPVSSPRSGAPAPSRPSQVPMMSHRRRTLTNHLRA